MLKVFNKFFDSNEKAIKELSLIVEKINSLEPEFKKIKDKDFGSYTAGLKKRLGEGETLDDILPEAFAFIREVIRRVLGERAYDVQLVAAIAIHRGKIVEQKTGEGKTLASTIAAYLNGLSGRGVHIVTVNDYLARRDTGWYGKSLALAGLSLSCIVHEEAFLLDLEYVDKSQADERLKHLKPVPRKEAYRADITYGTNNEFGFDYLRDNMALSLEGQSQRGHHFAIVDEVDSILIDEARTPLIISAPDVEPTDKYYDFASLIKTLSEDTDYTIDEKLKTAHLTEHGIKKVEKRLNVDNLYEKDFDTIHHIENALKARTLFLKDRDYVVKEDQIVIVDEFTGRLMQGRRWSEGLHQAVEAKENVKIQQESITMATISFQNYFRLYEKLSGMTGTASTEAEEFQKIYELETVIVPTNKSLARIDKPDLVYKTHRSKYDAIVQEITDCWQRGQPVLVGTTSISKNEIISKFLKKKKVPHNVLNAKQHEREAQIIAQAGKKKAVTVATNMAGRGVDIVLGGSKQDLDKKGLKVWQKEHDEVLRSGGLHVIGTERHESRRIDNQLRGRAGRQGDAGSSRFFVSLDDDVMRLFGGEKIASLMTMLKLPDDQPIEHNMVSRSIEQAQSKVEGFNFDARKQVVEYDDVMNKQREIIYKKRQEILVSEGKEEFLKAEIVESFSQEIESLISMYAPEGFEKIEIEKILIEFYEILPLDQASQAQLKKKIEAEKTPEKIKEVLKNILVQAYKSREGQIGKETMRKIESYVYLKTIDRLWVDHLDAMNDLRDAVGLRGYGQKDPLVEYKREAFSSFERLMGSIDHDTVRQIFRVQPAQQQTPMVPKIQTNIDQEDKMGLSSKPKQAARKPGVKKIGRNDPCWCGSGKKWKRCHYPDES